MTRYVLVRTYPPPLRALPTDVDELWAYSLRAIYRPAGAAQAVQCSNVCGQWGHWLPTYRICGRDEEFPTDASAKDTRGVYACPPCALRFVNHRYFGVFDLRWERRIQELRRLAVLQERARYPEA